MAADVVAIALAAAQGIDLRRPLATSPVLEKVMAHIRARVARLDIDREMAPDVAAAKDIVLSGALAPLVGLGVMD